MVERWAEGVGKGDEIGLGCVVFSDGETGISVCAEVKAAEGEVGCESLD